MGVAGNNVNLSRDKSCFSSHLPDSDGGLHAY